MNLYHISEKNLDNKILYPRIPDNYMTKNGYEDNKTRRISFSKSIDGCLVGLSANIKGKEFYIHMPIDDNIKIKNITNKDVPDSDLTEEVWALEPVKIKMTGKIRVLDSIDEPLVYKYGNNEASLYKWKWKSISLTESVEDIINYYNGYKQGIFEYTKEFEDERIRILKETDDSNIIESLGWIPGVPINSNNIFRVEALNKSRNNYIREVDFTQDEVLNDKNKFYDWVLNTDETIEDLYDKEPIEESYIFSEKDLYINFDKFESGQSNILLITGLSGSGKSTIGSSLSSKYKAEIIELDIFEHNNGYSDKNLMQAGEVFYEYFTKERKDLRDPIDKLKKMDHDEFSTEIKKFLNYVLKYCNSHKDKKFIIEGVQIYSHLESNKIKGKPIILVNTSVRDSILRRFRRNSDSKKIDWRSELKNEFPQLLLWYINDEKEYNKFKKEILKEEYIEEKLSYKERQKLKDSDFGIPKLRKYPLHDEGHVRTAIKFFNHVDKKYEKELAENIIKRMNELNLYDIEIGKDNKFYDYYQKSIEIDVKENFEYIIEEANKRNEEPIYILLTKTGSTMSKAISTVLGDFYTHVSLSFDLNMDKIYAFDKNGFIIEELQKTYKNQFGNIPIAVYCIFMNKNSIQMIKNRIDNMMKDKKKYRYNYLGALGLAFEKPVHINNSMFCSEFVDQLLKFSGNDITGKNSGLVTPQDFKRSKLVYKIYEGTLNRYSITRAQKNLSKLRSRIFTESYINESTIVNEVLNITKDDRNDWHTYANEPISGLYNLGPCDQGLNNYRKSIKESYFNGDLEHGINKALPYDHPLNQKDNKPDDELENDIDQLVGESLIDRVIRKIYIINDKTTFEKVYTDRFIFPETTQKQAIQKYISSDSSKIKGKYRDSDNITYIQKNKESLLKQKIAIYKLDPLTFSFKDKYNIESKSKEVDILDKEVDTIENLIKKYNVKIKILDDVNTSERQRVLTISKQIVKNIIKIHKMDKYLKIDPEYDEVKEFISGNEYYITLIRGNIHDYIINPRNDDTKVKEYNKINNLILKDINNEFKLKNIKNYEVTNNTGDWDTIEYRLEVVKITKESCIQEMLNIVKDNNNDWHTYANESIGGLYNFGNYNTGLHNYLKVSDNPNLIIKNNEFFVPNDIMYGDELTLSSDDMEYIIRKMHGGINRALPIDHPDNKHPNYTKSNLSEYLDESCIYIEEKFDYWKKDKDGNKILDEDKIKKDLSDMQNDRDKDRAFKLLCNLFLNTLSSTMKILGFTLMITIVALPVGLLLSILAVIIKYSVYAISKEERLNKLKDSLDKEINKLNKKIQKESNEDNKKEMRRLLGELEKCNKIISDTLKNYEQQNNLKLKQKNIRKLDTYNYVEFDPDEYTKSEIISLMKKYKEGKQDLTLQTIEFFYLCDYTEKSFIKLIGSNRTKELIEYLEDTKSYNVIEYFKNKTLGRIADNGAGDETLYCQEDKKVYFFNHEEHPQISLSNTTTLNSILSTSKQMCMKQPILMNIYNNKNELLKELYMENDYIIKEAKEFPIQFDKDGSLIVKNIKKLNFEEEYQKSHKLLLSYDKTDNYEGMKYELSKLWYMNIELERRIYNSNRDESKLNGYTRVRARILNDFNKYIKIINKKEKDFNFSEYYEESPFNDGSTKLRKSTLDYLGNYLKQIIKNILI